MRIAYLIGLLAGTIIRAHHTAERARAAAESTPIFDQLARERAFDDVARQFNQTDFVTVAADERECMYSVHDFDEWTREQRQWHLQGRPGVEA